ncbi:hypothetical protein V6760_03960 [Acinetobacter venetianus]
MNLKPNIFNSAGVIPPVFDPEGVDRNRSPYTLSINDFVNMFSYTPERITILENFLRHRIDLYNVGILEGFQWLNGSFTTDVEVTEQRPPNDIDVVTFFHLPEGETQLTFLPKTKGLLDSEVVKPNYMVDIYPVVLGDKITSFFINDITYWYSMWSHRKSDNMWKGFIQVPLSPNEDHLILENLTGGNA